MLTQEEIDKVPAPRASRAPHAPISLARAAVFVLHAGSAWHRPAISTRAVLALSCSFLRRTLRKGALEYSCSSAQDLNASALSTRAPPA